MPDKTSDERPKDEKVEVKITGRFDFRGQLYGPGIWPVTPLVAQQLIQAGKATKVGATTTAPVKAEKVVTPPKNPRIPEKKESEAEVTATELPEDFPSRELLISAGFDSVEKLKADNVKEELGKIEGLGAADITKIGLAISKI